MEPRRLCNSPQGTVHDGEWKGLWFHLVDQTDDEQGYMHCDTTEFVLWETISENLTEGL